MTDALREALQVAIYALEGVTPCAAAECQAEQSDDVRFALKTLRTALQEPAPVVAREPTEAMLQRFHPANRARAAEYWRAMYDAAPQAPVEPAPAFGVPERNDYTPVNVHFEDGHTEPLNDVIADAKKWRAQAVEPAPVVQPLHPSLDEPPVGSAEFHAWVNAPTTYRERYMAIQQDPAASQWLKNALAQLSGRDPVDAARDARTLLQVFELQLREIQP